VSVLHEASAPRSDVAHDWHGPWNCPSCTCHNGPLALMCQACGAIRPLELAAPAASAVGISWLCSQCTYMNDADRGVCEMCLVPRNGSATASGQAAQAFWSQRSVAIDEVPTAATALKAKAAKDAELAAAAAKTRALKGAKLALAKSQAEQVASAAAAAAAETADVKAKYGKAEVACAKEAAPEAAMAREAAVPEPKSAWVKGPRAPSPGSDLGRGGLPALGGSGGMTLAASRATGAKMASTAEVASVSSFSPPCCPLCCEEFSAQEKHFLPCSCTYKICIWCWHKIRDDGDGLCPACRVTYPDQPHQFKEPCTASAAQPEPNASKKMKKKKKKGAQALPQAPEVAPTPPPPVQAFQSPPDSRPPAAPETFPAAAQPAAVLQDDAGSKKKKKKKKKSNESSSELKAQVDADVLAPELGVDPDATPPTATPLAAAPTQSTALNDVLAYLGISTTSSEALFAEEFDTGCVLDCTLKDFAAVGCTDEDSARLMAWADGVR